MVQLPSVFDTPGGLVPSKLASCFLWADRTSAASPSICLSESGNQGSIVILDILALVGKSEDLLLEGA